MADGLKLALFGLQQPHPPIVFDRQPQAAYRRALQQGNGWYGFDLDTANRYAELGVHRLAIQPHTMDGSAMDTLITTIGDTLIGRV